MLIDLPGARLLFDPGFYDTSFPIHQAGNADVHQQLHYQLFRGLATAGTDIRVLGHATRPPSEETR